MEAAPHIGENTLLANAWGEQRRAKLLEAPDRAHDKGRMRPAHPSISVKEKLQGLPGGWQRSGQAIGRVAKPVRLLLLRSTRVMNGFSLEEQAGGRLTNGGRQAGRAKSREGSVSHQFGMKPFVHVCRR